MKQSTKLSLTAFTISSIVIAALCGFLLVDLSIDRYLPEQPGPFFQILDVNSDGMDLGFLGEAYHLDSSALDGARELVWEYRGFLPRSAGLSGLATLRGFAFVHDALEARRPVEEPW